MKTNIIKKVLTAALAATLTFTTLAIPTSAAWKITDSGKQWVEIDGTVAKSKWITTKSGDRYYVNSKGIMATGLLNLSEKVNGKKVKNTYYFNKSGVMQTGWQYVNKNYYYFDTKTGRAYKGTKKLDGYTLTFSDKGVWDQKLYKNGKDVTTDALKEKLTGIKQVVKNPDTITIKGQEYSTKLTKLTLNQADLTDEDLEPLKYMTKLKYLNIVPCTNATNINETDTQDVWDYKNIKFVETKFNKYNGKTYYMYEATQTVRDTSVDITNIDFCKYMPKLEGIHIAYAPKLTDLTGLQNLKHLLQITFFNCTGLVDLHALDNVAFAKYDDYSMVSVIFTDNVTYAFKDFYFGKRITTYNDYFQIIASEDKCIGSSTIPCKQDTSIGSTSGITFRTQKKGSDNVYYDSTTYYRNIVYKGTTLYTDYTA